MNKDFEINKYISVHNLWRGKGCFEFDLLPSIIIDDWRVLFAWLFFSLQITFKAKDEEDW